VNGYHVAVFLSYFGVLLLPLPVSEGPTVYDTEWWRFDYKHWRLYPIGNQTFEQLSK
jgi:hypothetical protein